MKKIGVLLSGCGVYDGAEIHEAVLTLLAIDRAGAEALCLAPNIPQAHVINHLTGQPSLKQTRNVLEEAARIARGDIRDTATTTSADFDALILPGGYGAAKNLCDSAFAGEGEITVEPSVARLIESAFLDKKPLGFICIAPVIAATVLGKYGIELTIGCHEETAASITKTGAVHVPQSVYKTHTDPRYPIVSTPAYMLAKRISEVATGIEALVAEVIRLIK